MRIIKYPHLISRIMQYLLLYWTIAIILKYRNLLYPITKQKQVYLLSFAAILETEIMEPRKTLKNVVTEERVKKVSQKKGMEIVCIV